MAVPSFKQFWGPTLQAVSDGEARTIDDVADLVAWHFNLSDADRTAMTRGGSNTQVRDRINWTTTYLVQAGLLSRPFRNQIQITERGKNVLRELDRGRTLDLALLRRFPEFVEFERRRGTRQPGDNQKTGNIVASPGNGHTDESSDLTTSSGFPRDRLSRLMRQFVAGLTAPELLMVAEQLLVSAGYRRLDERCGDSSDNDASESTSVMGLDAFGVARMLVQTIRTETPVHSVAIHRFVREMSARRCRYGVLIAQHDFAPDGREALALIEKDVVLIDGQDLARHLADRALGGVSPCAGIFNA